MNQPYFPFPRPHDRARMRVTKENGLVHETNNNIAIIIHLTLAVCNSQEKTGYTRVNSGNHLVFIIVFRTEQLSTTIFLMRLFVQAAGVAYNKALPAIARAIHAKNLCRCYESVRQGYIFVYTIRVTVPFSELT